MIIESLHIDKFGKLQDFAMNFSDGNNVILGLNEAGKSTLMDFIFSILYGMDKNSTNISNSRRSKRMPWDAKTMGGSMVLRDQENIFKITANFGETKRQDELKIMNCKSGVCDNVKPDQSVGQLLLKMNAREFTQSVFVKQLGLDAGFGNTKEPGITEMLTNVKESADENISCQRIIASLEERRNSILSSKTRTNPPTELTIIGREIDRYSAELTEAQKREADITAKLNDFNEKKKEAEYLQQANEDLKIKQKLVSLAARYRDCQNKESFKSQKLKEIADLDLLIKNDEPKITKLNELIPKFKAAAQDINNQKTLINNNISTKNKAANFSLDLLQAMLTKTGADQNTETMLADESLCISQKELFAKALAQNKQNVMQELNNKIYDFEKQEKAILSNKDQITSELSKKEFEQSELEAKIKGQARNKNVRALSMAATLIPLVLGIMLGLFLRPWFFALSLLALFGVFMYMKSENSRKLQKRYQQELETVNTEIAKIAERQNANTKNYNQIKQTLQALNDTKTEQTTLLATDETNFQNAIQQLEVCMQTLKNDIGNICTAARKYAVLLSELETLYPENDSMIQERNEQILSGASGDHSPYAQRFLIAENWQACQHLLSDNAADNYDYDLLLKEFDKLGALLAQGVEFMAAKIRDVAAAAEKKRNLQRDMARINTEHSGIGIDELMNEAGAYGIDLANEADRILSDIDNAYYKDKQLQNQIEQNAATLANITHDMVLLNGEIKEQMKKKSSIDLQRQIDDLKEQQAKAEHKAYIIGLAKEEFKAASSQVRKHFYPQLQSKFREYVKFLTSDKYDSEVDAEMKVQLSAAGIGNRDLAYMSNGTVDQIYLALRLALLSVINDKVPPFSLILDDAFVQLDDEREKRALELICSFAGQEKRQVLFLTCHDDTFAKACSLGFEPHKMLEQMRAIDRK